MLSSINPLVERGRNNRYGLTATAYVVASALGGVVAGSAAGLAGWLLQTVMPLSDTGRAAMVVVVLAAALAFDVRVFGLSLPTTRRQVDENWLGRYRGWVYGAGFGFQLGLGVVTIVTTATVYATFALAAITASLAIGAVIGLVFGLARGLVLLTGAGIHDTDHLRAFHRRLAARAGTVARIGVVANGALLGTALVVLR
jgi:sulfite exporter TauE/SafE